MKKGTSKCYRCGCIYTRIIDPEVMVKRHYPLGNETMYDLCDKCTTDLKAFLKGARVNKPTRVPDKKS